MKLLRNDSDVRNDDSPNLGFEVAVVLGIFFGLGWLIDRLAGTTPVFMIAMTIFGAVALFVTFYYRYEARMAAHEAERAERLSGERRAQ